MPKLAPSLVGIEERVDRGQTVVQHVDDGNHAQRSNTVNARRNGIAKFNEARVDLALQQELRVLLAAVIVHAAAAWRVD